MMRLWKEIKYWCQLLLLPLYALSYLMPRNNRLWVFGSTFGRRYADNPKYFYLYLTKYKPEQVRPIWITKNKEVLPFLWENHLEGYYLYSLKGIWYSLRAKVYLYDNYSKDICYTLSGGAVKINLWHGIPLKKIQQDNIFDRFRNPGSFREKLYAVPRRISDEKPSHYVLSASAYFKEIFASAFRTKNVLVAGYPRNDMFLDDKAEVVLTEQDKRAVEKISKMKDCRCVLYMPTFRESEKKFFEVLELKDFVTYLEQEKRLFCVKLHPKSRLQAEFARLESRNIIIADPQADPYPLCRLADVLVTDYSSIYFDYLLTDKPIIFFPYDYEEYLSGSRELYFNYEEFTPGIKVRNQNELQEALLAQDDFQHKRQELKEKLFGNMKECGSGQLFRQIWNILN